MPRANRQSPEILLERRRALHQDVTEGGLPTAEAIRRMRAALGMTQAQFGKIFGLTTRQVWELEAGAANPTTATLNRLGKAFGFTVGFVAPRKPDRA